MIALSVGLVDDHPLLLRGVVSLLEQSSEFQVVQTGLTSQDIVDISTAYHPDVIVTDLSMPGDVYRAIATAATLAPDTKILAFTAAAGIEPAIRALDAGATGYVLKGSPASELIQAIEAVHRGETYITQSFASKVIAGLRDSALRRKAAEAVKLSIREEQIVKLLVRGNTNKEIADALKISEKTVKHHMTYLMQKLHARNRTEAVIAVQKLIQTDQPDHIPLQLN
jgi:DNA-binding NarL/FixJ family response regulator